MLKKLQIFHSKFSKVLSFRLINIFTEIGKCRPATDCFHFYGTWNKSHVNFKRNGWYSSLWRTSAKWSEDSKLILTAKCLLHGVQVALNSNRRWICYCRIMSGVSLFYPLSECAPSTSFYLLSLGDQVFYTAGLRRSGFVCRQCRPGPYIRCTNCSLCAAGFYNDIDGSYDACRLSPAGRLGLYI